LRFKNTIIVASKRAEIKNQSHFQMALKLGFSSIGEINLQIGVILSKKSVKSILNRCNPQKKTIRGITYLNAQSGK